MSTFEHYLTYQHNVQRFFEEHIDKYDGVVLPLSITVSFATGTRGFIRTLVSRDSDKIFFLDPRSPLFQKDWNRKKHMRDPLANAAATFGPTVRSINVDHERRLELSDFDSGILAKEITHNAITYQLSYPNQQDEKRKLAKYQKMLGEGRVLHELGNPVLLTPPYFEYRTTGDPWYKVSTNCIEHALPIARDNNIDLRPVFHFKKWTEVGYWGDAFDFLQKNTISSFWFYPNNFKELSANAAELAAYRAGVEDACKRDLSPFSLFGGYFAILLSKYGLCGFCNGIGYGEWRDSGYHRGGSPMTRIYIPKLHRFLDAPKADDLLERDTEGYFSSDSEFLSEIVDSGDLLEDVAQSRALHHFVDTRDQEINQAEASSVSELIDELFSTVQVLQGLGDLDYEDYGRPLERWAQALQ